MRRTGQDVRVAVDDVVVNDIVVVRPGEKIPLDGVVTARQAQRQPPRCAQVQRRARQDRPAGRIVGRDAAYAFFATFFAGLRAFAGFLDRKSTRLNSSH